jgi:excisionase family DNA binding protein
MTTPLRVIDAVASPPLLDVASVAARLAVSERFVRRLVFERRIPFHKIGHFVRFDAGDVEKWIQATRVPAGRHDGDCLFRTEDAMYGGSRPKHVLRNKNERQVGTSDSESAALRRRVRA